MASETPGGDRHSLRRRRLTIDKSSDKYYASTDVSAIGSSPTDMRGRPDEPAGPVPLVRTFRSDSRDTDKFYADLTIPVPRQQPAKKAAAAKPVSKAAARPAAVAKTGVVKIGSISAIPAMLENVAACVQSGQYVTVLVPTDDTKLLNRVRAAVDTLVTRGLIDRNDRVLVTIGYQPKHQVVDPIAELPAPVPVSTIRVEDREQDEEDELDFLEKAISSKPVVFNEETISNDGLDELLTPAARTGPAAANDDEGEDFPDDN